ncbi:MAG: threonine synthase [Acidobacteriota bacterium]|jgi:threonine synthase|nr:threonine synthase [Acidobacteriota bacterium]
MRYVGTRGGAPPVGLSEAVQTSLAPDGGLYVPEWFPRFTVADFDGLESLPEIAEKFLAPFCEGDALAPHLEDICREAFNFPIPLNALDDATAVLELFHGPTAAFKDVGARFLAACVSRLPGRRTVLAATSGDTGGAVAAAFHGHASVQVVILFPKGLVSPRQQKQLTCWGANVRAFAVRGDFDDCQRIVKAAFSDRELSRARGLLSANSINLGRLLPQAAYHAAASLWYLRRRGERAGLIVPTGNLGNAVAAFWARASGLPIREIALAANANRAVPDYFSDGAWQPRPTVRTLANAMDVGDPSNMERLLQLHPDLTELKRFARAFTVGDEEIARTIADDAARGGHVWDPHTAAAVHVRARLASPHWIIVATAHPAKFESIVEPLVGRTLETPPALAELLHKPSVYEELEPSPAALAEVLR